MSRILKRPMFRKGGEVMSGIMTGIKPRQNFQDGIRSMRRILMDDPLDVRSTVLQRNKSFSNTISSIV